MKPSPALSARVRFTTKQVAGGFYRGTRTGAMGAHTEYGGYVIDWRKVRHYNVPDLKGLKDFHLTPYVSNEIEAPKREMRFDGGRRYVPPLVDPKGFLRAWRDRNPAEFDHVVTYQREQSEAEEALLEEADNGLVDAPARLEAGAEPAKEVEKEKNAST